MKGCVFVSIDGGTARNDFPNSGNIIKRGVTEVGAVHHFIKTVVTSSKEDGASADTGAEAVDEDAVDMEENDVTICGMDGKMLRNVFNHFPLHDIRSTLACVNSKWRETALDATPSPDDYLTTLEEDRIPVPSSSSANKRNKSKRMGESNTSKYSLEKGLCERITKIFGECYQPATLHQNGVSISNRPKQFHKRRKGGFAVVQI